MKKEFYDKWDNDEIKEWIDQYGVLVLFGQVRQSVAQVIIHGKMTPSQRNDLAEKIAGNFGGSFMTRRLCEEINDFAEKWYSEIVLGKKARVININTRKKKK